MHLAEKCCQKLPKTLLQSATHLGLGLNSSLVLGEYFKKSCCF